MEAVVLALGISVAFAALVVVTSVLRGWVLSILWMWFFVPLGAPPVNIPIAIGVSLVIGFLTHQHQDDGAKKSASDRIGSAFLAALISPFLVLFIGWIVKQFL